MSRAGHGVKKKKEKATSIRRFKPGSLKHWKQRGYHAERQLVKLLRSRGWLAIRIPVSGPGKEYPDILATKGVMVAAVEVKKRDGKIVYIEEDQVQRLFNFLNMFEPYKARVAIIAARFGRRWVFKKIEAPEKIIISEESESNWSP